MIMSEVGCKVLERLGQLSGTLHRSMDAAAFIPVLILAEVEIIMILYNIVKEQIVARHKRREERFYQGAAC